MRVLILSAQPPITSRMPGSPRLFELSRRLDGEHELFLVHFPTPEELERQFAGDPAATGVFHGITRLPLLPSPRWRYRQLHRLLQAPCFSTRFTHPAQHRDLRRRVAEEARRCRAELVYVDGLQMMQYVPSDSSLPIVVDVCDCLSSLARQTAARARRPGDRLRYLLESRSIARLEAATGRRSDRVIAITDVDAQALGRAAPAARVVVIPNGVDTDYFSPAPEAGDPRRLVFTGVMDYAPNEDAVVWFCDEILPRIHRVKPDVELWTVGSNPSAQVRQLEGRPGVRVTGTVPDIRPFVRGAGVYVSPVRLGSGMKNKILAALAMERAVVATTASLHGIHGQDGEHLLIADGPERFAESVLRLAGDPALAGRLGSNGRALVLEEYSWEASAQRLLSVFEEVVAERRGGRPAERRRG